LPSESGVEIGLQGKSMTGELRRRSFHTSDAFFDMDSLIFRNSELCSQFFEQKLAFERKQIYSDYLRRQ
jgi:hypothetical protein